MIREYGNYSLLQHNTFGLNARTSRFIEYDTLEDLKRIIREERIKEPYLHIGQGSNLLFTKDFEGTILHSCINSLEVTDETDEFIFLKVGAGMVWDEFVAYCVENGWYGAENLSDIPGEVGASAVQNIGAYGVEVKDLIVRVELVSVDGRELACTNEECKFAYRYSIFKEASMRNKFITYVHFRLKKQPDYTLDYGTVRDELEKYPEVTLEAVRKVIINIRSAKLPDPKKLGNAGSFFMNPVVSREKSGELGVQYENMPSYEVDDDHVKLSAAWLIEQSGWKGKSLGRAAVYEKQPLVLINKSDATADDVIALADAVKEAVKEKFGVELKPEVKFVG